MKQLESLGNENQFGVPHGDIRALAKKIKTNHELALAFGRPAIQGLNRKLEERCQKADMRVQNLEAENAQLKRQLAEIKALVQSLLNKWQL